MKRFRIAVLAWGLLVGFQGLAAPAQPTWFFSVGSESNKVLGLYRVQKDGSKVTRMGLGKEQGAGVRVDLSQATLTFPSKTNPTGRYKVIQVLIQGNKTKLFYYEAPRVDQMNRFDSCLLRAETKQPIFEGVGQLQKTMEVQVIGRTPEALQTGWNHPDIAQARKTFEAMTQDWQTLTDSLAPIAIATQQDCLKPSLFEAALKKWPKLTSLSVEDKDWDRVEEEFPVLPVASMTEYISYWSSHQSELPAFYIAKIFDGPFGSVKTQLIAMGDEKYEADGRSTKAQAIRAEFKLGLLSILAKPVFNFWLGKDTREVLYTTGNPGMGESFESFLLR